MDSIKNTRANLKKYIKVGGKWRFVPVMKQTGVPYPGTVLVAGAPLRSTSGTFYLEFYENGRRVQRLSVPLLARQKTPGTCIRIPKRTPDQAQKKKTWV